MYLSRPPAGISPSRYQCQTFQIEWAASNWKVIHSSGQYDIGQRIYQSNLRSSAKPASSIPKDFWRRLDKAKGELQEQLNPGQWRIVYWEERVQSKAIMSSAEEAGSPPLWRSLLPTLLLGSALLGSMRNGVEFAPATFPMYELEVIFEYCDI
jgi:hypothetical protein